MSQNGKVCHIHENPDNYVVSYHTLDGVFEGTGKPGDKRLSSDMLGLAELGYRFSMCNGGEHIPFLSSPSEYTRAELSKLRLPMALPD